MRVLFSRHEKQNHSALRRSRRARYVGRCNDSIAIVFLLWMATASTYTHPNGTLTERGVTL